MINEYALDPRIVNSWERLQRILSQFGFDKNRLIARIPSKWRKSIIDALPEQLPETERSRIVEKLRNIEELISVRRAHAWTPQQDWLENVLEIHQSQAFALILTATGTAIDPPIVPYAELDETDPPDGWVVSGRVERRKEAMVNSLRLVLQSASQTVKFIEPHFHPLTRRFVLPMAEFLRCISKVRIPGAYPEIEIHTSAKHDAKTYSEHCNAKLALLMPIGTQLRILRWPEQKLHNRYVLTEKAAVYLGAGTDENDKGTQGNEHDLFKLLNARERQELLHEYDPNESPFGKPSEALGNDFFIEGKASS